MGRRANGWKGALAAALSVMVLSGTAAGAAGAKGVGVAVDPAEEVLDGLPAMAFPVEESKLANGLRVILAPDDALPDVTVMVRYGVGSRDEPAGLRGIAHLTEHLLFEGSRHVAAGDHTRMLHLAGGTDINAETGFDTTTYHATVPPERLELALWLESDRLGYFLDAVGDATVEQERRVVLAEYAERYTDPALGKLALFIPELVFPEWHPYHGGPGGIPADIEGIGLADVKAFFTTWYAPENATLILVGRFDRAKAKALVERYFGTIPARPTPKRPVLPPLDPRAAVRVEVAAGVVQEHVAMAWATPAAGSKESAALAWASSLLAGTEHTRLSRRLVRSGLARQVEAEQSALAAKGYFVIEALVSKGQSADAVRAAIDEELTRLGEEGPTKGELAGLRPQAARSAVFGLETSGGRARLIAHDASLGALPQPFDWVQRSVLSITAEEVRAAVASHLQPALRAALIVSRPRRGSPPSGEIVRKEAP